MHLFDFFKSSIKVMLANKARTFLTVLGIMVGIAAVIVVYSAGEGISGLVFKQVESFGTDIIETEIKVPSDKKGQAGETESAGALATGVQITTLTLDDMEAVTRNSKNVKAGYGAIMGQEIVTYTNETRKAFLFGTSADYINIDKSQIDSGRWFTDSEDRSLASVAIIGSKMKAKLFGDQDPIGKSITIRKEKFTVIGVMKERGTVMFLDFDDYVYVPIRTVQKKIMGINHIMYMVHQLNNVDLALDTAEEARYILRERHGITNPDKDDFRVVTMIESMDTLKTITGAITLLLLGIVAISLIVGGVGVMNIMYVIVSERTAEIGLRKAVGATFYDVMSQFLVESVMITTLGGIVGVGLGIGLSFLISLVATSFGLEWQFIIPLRAYVVAGLFSLVFGVLFGLYPARQAARLDPIEALRNE
jgi:putative ABC transport system permease protein